MDFGVLANTSQTQVINRTINEKLKGNLNKGISQKGGSNFKSLQLTAGRFSFLQVSEEIRSWLCPNLHSYDSGTCCSRAHYTSNALFDSNNLVKSVFYEAIDSNGKTKKVQLTKEKFIDALHLPVYNSKEMVVPSAEQLVEMFNEMGYSPPLEKISTFKKNQLPDIWRYYFSIFLRCLSGRTSGLDSASVSF
ncbi:hypothetical protein L1887_39053 [Cichorium endivia]|nr:hypothetical protein L1887_39053 [Cichorium endivia]